MAKDPQMKLKGNDHLVLGPQIEERIFEAAVHHEDGEVSIAHVMMDDAGNGDSESQILSPCKGAPDGVRAFHLKDDNGSGRGPAKVNSAAYCASYERIFGKRDEHGAN